MGRYGSSYLFQRYWTKREYNNATGVRTLNVAVHRATRTLRNSGHCQQIEEFLQLYDPIYSLWAGWDKRSVFKRAWAGLNSEFSFEIGCRIKKAHYLARAEERINVFMIFRRQLVASDRSNLSYQMDIQ